MVKAITQTKLQGWQIENKKVGGKFASAKFKPSEESEEKVRELENKLELLKISNIKKDQEIELLESTISTFLASIIDEKSIAESIPLQKIKFLEKVNSELQGTIDEKKQENAELGKVLLSLREKLTGHKLSEKKREDEFFDYVEKILNEYKDKNDTLKAQNEEYLQQKDQVQEEISRLIQYEEEQKNKDKKPSR
ncbi:unnamed protein product [Moneuplotes crassus]|uniref:Uncharacterized protein n=1 Tax=Euplotes crassus TaxID=5936 RepID=A0AAD1UQT2_EUPCR|nr:unnamed protein product [Moneuplotes crassus]